MNSKFVLVALLALLFCTFASAKVNYIPVGKISVSDYKNFLKNRNWPAGSLPKEYGYDQPNLFQSWVYKFDEKVLIISIETVGNQGASQGNMYNNI